MGFARTLNALLSHLPRSRQTLLFSATQTDSVKDLARLSLKEPIFVGVKEEGSSTATPKSLEQHYVICELDKKLDILWSFIKSHLKSKALVFLSSGKQVKKNHFNSSSTICANLNCSRFALSSKHSVSSIRALRFYIFTGNKSRPLV